MHTVAAVTKKIPVEVLGLTGRQIVWIAGTPAGWWIIDEEAQRVAGYERRLAGAIGHARRLTTKPARS